MFNEFSLLGVTRFFDFHLFFAIFYFYGIAKLSVTFFFSYEAAEKTTSRNEKSGRKNQHRATILYNQVEQKQKIVSKKVSSHIVKTVPIHFFLCLQCFSTIHYLRDIYTKLNYFSMFCTALISSHYSSNEADIKKFRIINIHSNHLFSTCFACFPRRSTCCKISNIFTC